MADQRLSPGGDFDMSNAVSLRELVNEMTETSERHTAFLNRNTGELLTLDELQRGILDSGHPDHGLTDWQRELQVGLESGDVVELPGAFEQKQYAAIERFCEETKDQGHKEKLLKAIRGKQAFSDFHLTIRKLGIEDHWIGFRQRVFEEIAIAWLEENNITYDRAA
jgi:hypothetical protein